jgi:hypothetical protein
MNESETNLLSVDEEDVEIGSDSCDYVLSKPSPLEIALMKRIRKLEKELGTLKREFENYKRNSERVDLKCDEKVEDCQPVSPRAPYKKARVTAFGISDLFTSPTAIKVED